MVEQVSVRISNETLDIAGTNNWAKYLAVPLLPTTLFFRGAALFPTESNISQYEGIHSTLPDNQFSPQTINSMKVTFHPAS